MVRCNIRCTIYNDCFIIILLQLCDELPEKSKLEEAQQCPASTQWSIRVERREMPRREELPQTRAQ